MTDAQDGRTVAAMSDADLLARIRAVVVELEPLVDAAAANSKHYTKGCIQRALRELRDAGGSLAWHVEGEPATRPGVLRSAACEPHGVRLCATCAGYEGGSPFARPTPTPGEPNPDERGG